jgi:hypothetical protein
MRRKTFSGNRPIGGEHGLDFGDNLRDPLVEDEMASID